MEVLFVSHSYPRPDNLLRGQAIHQPAKRLHKGGHSINVIEPVPWVPPLGCLINPRWERYESAPGDIWVEGVRVLHPRYIALPRALLQRSSGLSLFCSMQRCLLKYPELMNPDIVHVHTVFPDGYGAMRLSRWLGVPFCITVRGTDIDIRAASSYNARLMTHVLQEADAVISPSPQIHKKLQARFEIESVIIGNGFDLGTLQDQEYAFQIPESLQGRKIVTSISRLDEAKGIHLNLRAIKELSVLHPNILYLIAGEGPYRHRLEELVSELGIQESVVMLGHLNRSEVRACLALSDVFSLPSSQETFGIAYLEAMSMCKPVIGCRGQGIDGVIEHGVSGLLVEPGNLEALVNSIDYLLSNAAESQQIAERGKQISLNYTWESHVEKLVSLYEHVLSASRSAVC